jgi:hypothetical protein
MRFFIVFLALFAPVFAHAEMGWKFAANDEAVFLHYGDGLGFFCTQGMGTVGIYAEVPQAAATETLSFAASGQRFSYTATSIQTGLQVRVSADDPLFSAMSAGGVMRVEAGGAGVDVPLDGADIAGLQKACAPPL